jgi:hypothetical protein
METKIANLPDWTFHVDEVSAGVYRLTGKHTLGSTVELTGSDPKKLVEEARESAIRMERDINEKIK